jgi:hypothetical protein
MMPNVPSKAFTILNVLAFWGYALFLIFIGGIPGLLVPRWGPLHFEVFARAIFPAPLGAEVIASTLNQYRYMKSMEFGFGLFALLYRQEIYRSRKMNRYFLGIMVLGAIERTISIFIDGQPNPAYVYFAVIEFVVPAIIFAYSRNTLSED